MGIIIIIFFVVIIIALGMIVFRAWEIKTNRVEKPELDRNIFPKIYFRHVEKIILYLTKHIIQWVVLAIVKYSFIFHMKFKKWIDKKLPKIYKFFNPQEKNKQKNSFLDKAILESKIKIRNIKEKIKREHGN